ncbi:MAG: MFS transporter [Flammeovirgaceae bacterium]
MSPTQTAVIAEEKKVYTLQFWLLCASTFLFFGSFNMIIPELPNYLTSLGGADYKGLIISLFTVTAGLSRPFSGKLADTVGRIPVLMTGLIVSFLCLLVYPFIASIAAFFLLRLFHGFSTGFAPTGASSVIADIIPSHRRGEAMGVFGLCTSVGMALGTYLGGEIAILTSVKTMFYISAFIAFLSVVLAFTIKESLSDKVPFTPSLLKIPKNEFIETNVWLPSLVLMCYIFSYGAVITTSPDMSIFLGIENKGIYFSFSVMASLMVRIVAGKVSDIHGRSPVMKFSLSLLAIAMLLYGFSENVYTFFTSAILFGLGVGFSSPTVTAWVVDLSHANAKGKAMATMFIALELGIGLGAFLGGEIHNNKVENFPWVGIMAMSVLIVGLIFLFVFGRKHDIIRNLKKQSRKSLN